MVYVCFFLFLGLMIFAIAREIYSCFDHSGWSDNAHPDPNAKIINIKSEKVRYAKNDTKFETTIEFSDGFYIKPVKQSERSVLYFTPLKSMKN